MTAGATGFRRKRFVPFTIIAGCSWSLYSVGIGVLAGRWFHENHVLAAVLAIALALILGFIVDYAIKFVYRRRTAVERAREHATAAADRRSVEADGHIARTDPPTPDADERAAESAAGIRTSTPACTGAAQAAPPVAPAPHAAAAAGHSAVHADPPTAPVRAAGESTRSDSAAAR